MNARRIYCGGYPSINAYRERAYIWRDPSYYAITADGLERLPPNSYPDGTRVPPDPGSFVVADFGEVDRLAWQGGAASVEKGHAVVYAGGRYAMWVDDSALHVIDAQESSERTIRSSLFGGYRSLEVGPDRTVYITREAILMVSLDELLALPAGTATLEIRELYPFRKPNKVDRRSIVGLDEHAARLATDERWDTREVPHLDGMKHGMVVTLEDEVYKDTYRMLALPGQPAVAIREVPERVVATLTIAITTPVDPAPGGSLEPPEPPQRARELDELLDELSDAPDEATRTILVDLWNDAGESFAPLFARMLAGEHGLVTESLGLLAKYLLDVELVAGLPRHATLSDEGPGDWNITQLALDDQRLGLFHTLMIGDCESELYIRFITSPRAIGLRRIDASNPRILRAMIDAKRTQLTTLWGLKFGSKDTITALADPTFDRVTSVSFETEVRFLAKQLEWITRDEAGAWKRAPRHLVITDKHRAEAQMAPIIHAAWPKLPLAGITAGSVTLSR